MINIKDLIKDFKINNREELGNLFLCIYEYSFSTKAECENQHEIIKRKDSYLKKLSEIEDLERLWYGLYFEFTLFYNKNISPNPKLMDNSIKKTMKQLSSIDIDFLRKQFFAIENLMDSNMNGLAPRPILFVKYSNEDLFVEINKVKDKIEDFIIENDKIFSQKKCNSFYIINDEAVRKYVKKEEVFLELWIMSLSEGIMGDIIAELENGPLSNIIEKMTDEEIENLTTENLNEIFSRIANENNEEMNDLSEYIDNLYSVNSAYPLDDIILGITSNFAKMITDSKKAQKTIIEFINPINKQIIDAIFFNFDL